MRRTRVKVCGVTRAEDAVFAAMLGADAIGVVFAHSVRQVSLERAADIVARVPPFVSRVGVFADQPLDVVRSAIERCQLDAVQLSGNEPPDFAATLVVDARVIRVVHVHSASDLRALESYPAHAFVLDAPAAGAQMGGTGRRFAWELLDDVKLPLERLIVAGGLRPDNVGELLARLRPYAVDVSSGVESAPGEKDRQRIAAFLDAVRAADASHRESVASAQGTTENAMERRKDAFSG